MLHIKMKLIGWDHRPESCQLQPLTISMQGLGWQAVARYMCNGGKRPEAQFRYFIDEAYADEFPSALLSAPAIFSAKSNKKKII